MNARSRTRGNSTTALGVPRSTSFHGGVDVDENGVPDLVLYVYGNPTRFIRIDDAQWGGS